MIAQAGSDPMAWATIALLSPVMVIAGIVVASIGRRGRAGTLRRNRLAGLRTPTTMRSDAAWEAGHRAGGGLLVLAGVLFAGAGLTLLARPSNIVGMTIVFGSVGLVVALALVSTARANRAARAVD